MKYWVNRESSTNNVAILDDGSIIVGSCDEEAVDSVTNNLTDGKDYTVTFGSDNYKVITFSQLESVVTRSTENEIEFEFKAKKELDTLSIDFESEANKTAFFTELESSLPSKFKKKEAQQSAISAAFPSFLAFGFGVIVAFLYWNKLRWVTLIVGGIWLTISAYSCYQRLTNPPIVTTLSARNVAASIWQKLKVAGSLAFLMILALAFSTQVSDSYGENALADHIDADELTADNLPVLLSRGSDINSVSKYGWTALHQAIYEDNLALFSAALAAGANPRLDVEDTGTPLDFLIDYERANMLDVVLNSSLKQNELSNLMERVVSSSDNISMLTTLYDAGLTPKTVNKDGNNALQIAVANGSSYDVIRFLLEKKVPRNVQINGQSLASYASENGQDDVALLFSEEPRDYAKDQQLSLKIDSYFLEKVKGQLENASPMVKLIMNSEGGMTDADYQDMVDEATGSLQHKSMRAWGNNLVLSSYADLCKNVNYVDAKTLLDRTIDYRKKNQGDIEIASLIFERNRPVYVESDGDYIVPKAIQQRYQNAKDKLIGQFKVNEGMDTAALFEKCERILGRMKKQD